MVELVEVEDESFENKQAGPSDEEDYTDTDSEISTDDEDNLADEETIFERISALRDIVPPATRNYVAGKVDTTTSWVKYGFSFTGKALFVLSTSALMLGVPWALAFAEEQQMIEMEKEMKMRESGQELLTQESATTAGALNAQLNGTTAKAAL